VALFLFLFRWILLDPLGIAGPGRLASEAAVGLLGWLACLTCLFPGEREELYSVLFAASPSSVRFLYRRVGWKAGISGAGEISTRGTGG
jgi:hypothetical protein